MITHQLRSIMYKLTDIASELAEIERSSPSDMADLASDSRIAAKRLTEHVRAMQVAVTTAEDDKAWIDRLSAYNPGEER